MKQTGTIIAKIIASLEKRISHIRKALHLAEEAERVREKGELLRNASEFRKGMDRITLTDYYSGSLETVTVETNPSLDRFGNAEHYFKKARKLEKSVPHQKQRLKQAEKTFEQAVYIQKQFEEGSFTEEEIQEKLGHMGFGRFFAAYNKPRRKKERKELLRTFTSTDGFTIYAGKSAEDNDYVTFHLGTGKDIWLHASGYAGSHVLIKRKKGQDIPRNTLKQAAALAVYYSKARGHYRTEVTWSYIHNIHRASRRQPGKVTVANPDYIKPDKKALDDIVKNAE